MMMLPEVPDWIAKRQKRAQFAELSPETLARFGVNDSPAIIAPELEDDAPPAPKALEMRQESIRPSTEQLGLF